MSRLLEPTIVEPSETLIVALPGAQEVDDNLVDQAVAHINQVYTVKGLETVRDIGEYLICTFFQPSLIGDPLRTLIFS